MTAARTDNHGRDFWFLPPEPKPIQHQPVPLTVVATSPVAEPDPPEFDELYDAVEASSAMAGQVLKPGVVASIARAALHLLGLAKSPAPSTSAPATGDPSNP